MKYTPVYKTMDEVREMVEVSQPREVINEGKIYTYGDYLLMNDRGVGIHIYNISNPNNPEQISFIKIPGNVDMAVKDNHLHADNFTDLVTFNISDIANPVLVNREEGAFPDNVSVHELAGTSMVDRNKGVAVDWIEEEVDLDCEGRGTFWEDDVMFRSFSEVTNTTGGSGTGNPTTGQGGSMAKFTVMGQTLYMIDLGGKMRFYDLKNPANPNYSGEVDIAWDIETIFPFYRNQKQYIFIGARSGMHIFDNSVPENPEYIAKFLHVSSCDPVVAEDSIAYVTLRNGTECEGFTNELQLIDIRNIDKPELIATYDMHNPHGLGIDDGLLFICDGDKGLKIYDLREQNTKVDKRLIKHFEGFKAYDVIPRDGLLILSSDDGFKLIDYSDVNNIQIVSTIL